MPTKQTFISGTSANPPTAANFACLMGDSDTWGGIEYSREAIIPTAGRLTNFKVGIKVAPGAGAYWTFTIWKNNATTALSVQIADAAVLSVLSTNDITVAAGDRISLRSRGTGAPTLAGAVYWRCDFIPNTSGETILLSNAAGQPLVANSFYAPMATSFSTLVEFNAQILFPTAGTLKKFYVRLVVAPGGATSRSFTIRKNGVDTGLVVTISGADINGNNTAAGDAVDIDAGDRVSIQHTVTGAPAVSAARFGIVFLPDNPGEWIASATTGNPTSSTAVEYQRPNCGFSYLVATENEQHGLAPATTAKKIYVNLSAAPGLGESWIFTLREALSDTALTVTIADADTSGNATVNEVIAEDALVDTLIDATAGLVTVSSQIAYLFYDAPTAAPTAAFIQGNSVFE